MYCFKSRQLPSKINEPLLWAFSDMPLTVTVALSLNLDTQRHRARREEPAANHFLLRSQHRSLESCKQKDFT